MPIPQVHAKWLCALATITLLAIFHEFGTSKFSRNYDELFRVQESEATGQDSFDWRKIEPLENLAWVDCYSGRQCARLKVPLNYSDPNGRQATIAVIRVPSPLPPESDEYRGPVLFNPGGPGGSGVDLVVIAGNLLSMLIGPQFDVVSFDPRGIGRSTPRVSFFDTDVERAFWGGNFDNLNASSDAFGRSWARAQIIGGLAAEHDHGVLSHINTENTARDMLEITRAHGRDKIQYWGFSYGTVLGAAFASLFPDRIERLVLDGVVDSENYFATLWSNNLVDTNKTLWSFFEDCAEAGPESCPFNAPTPADIARNLTTLYDNLRMRPIPIHTDFSYGLVDYSRLRMTIFLSLYSPYAAFPLLAQGLADLAAGDASYLYRMLEMPLFDCACDSPGPHLEAIPDAQRAIICTDGEEVRDSLEESKKHLDRVLRYSEWAELWAGIRMGCSAWPRQAKRHFQGPFTGNTSHPILWVGNTADPVTPVAYAHKMARGFPGSVVLTQDSPGHCSIAAPSLCTQYHIRRYLLDGTLPENGTVCPVIGHIFPRRSMFESEDQAMLNDSANRAMLEVIKSLGRSFRVPFPLSPFSL